MKKTDMPQFRTKTDENEEYEVKLREDKGLARITSQLQEINRYLNLE